MSSRHPYDEGDEGGDQSPTDQPKTYNRDKKHAPKRRVSPPFIKDGSRRTVFHCSGHAGHAATLALIGIPKCFSTPSMSSTDRTI